MLPLPSLLRIVPRSQAIEAHGLGLAELAALDDAGLRKAGLITVRSRKAVADELCRLGLRNM